MATTNTSSKWHWYVRGKGANRYLGIVDDEGAAPTTALDIDIWYNSVPDEIASDDDTLGIADAYMMGLIKGVAGEIMQMSGIVSPLTATYQRDFERAVYDATHDNIAETQQPAIQAPLNLRVNE